MDDYMCPNCVTPWKCNGPHLLPDEPSVSYGRERTDHIAAVNHAIREGLRRARSHTPSER